MRASMIMRLNFQMNYFCSSTNCDFLKMLVGHTFSKVRYFQVIYPQIAVVATGKKEISKNRKSFFSFKYRPMIHNGLEFDHFSSKIGTTKWLIPNIDCSAWFGNPVKITKGFTFPQIPYLMPWCLQNLLMFQWPSSLPYHSMLHLTWIPIKVLRANSMLVSIKTSWGIFPIKQKFNTMAAFVDSTN